jgi:hypothetical protein
VFTTRYALSPYIKQIRFVFKGLNTFLHPWMYTFFNVFLHETGVFHLHYFRVLQNVQRHINQQFYRHTKRYRHIHIQFLGVVSACRLGRIYGRSERSWRLHIQGQAVWEESKRLLAPKYGGNIILWISGTVTSLHGVTFRISRQSAHEGGKVVSLTHRPHLPPRKYSWYSFLLEAELTAGP